MERLTPFDSVIHPQMKSDAVYQYYTADTFPTIHPIHWLTSHFAVGGWSPLQRLSGMLTAHMTSIAPQNGFTWHPHRGLEIYTWMLEGKIYHEDSTGGKGEIGAGELQRMFSGEWIEHQELNLWDDPARVIQIWFVADPEHQGVAPHYQQVSQGDLPITQVGAATVYHLIGDGSPMEQHMQGRLTATVLPAGGTMTITPPQVGEDLFLYVTDGDGHATTPAGEHPMRQYDVVMARPAMPEITVAAGATELNFLCFYLPSFLD